MLDLFTLTIIQFSGCHFTWPTKFRCRWREPASRDFSFQLLELVRWVGLVLLVSVDDEFGKSPSHLCLGVFPLLLLGKNGSAHMVFWLSMCPITLQED